MAFFEPLDIPEPKVSAGARVPFRPAESLGPPDSVVPGVVVLNLLLVHNERLAVWLSHAEAYRTGILLRVELRGRNPPRPEAMAGLGLWRFGVQLPDGQRVTTAGIGARVPNPATAVTVTPGERPSVPLLVAHGGGGSPTRFRQDYWLCPLPPPGDLLVACEWPTVALPLTTATIDAGQLREAADQARELWPAPDLSEWWEQPPPDQPTPPS